VIPFYSCVYAGFRYYLVTEHVKDGEYRVPFVPPLQKMSKSAKKEGAKKEGAKKEGAKKAGGKQEGAKKAGAKQEGVKKEVSKEEAKEKAKLLRQTVN
jgi:hypothetical protein